MLRMISGTFDHFVEIAEGDEINTNIPFTGSVVTEYHVPGTNGKCGYNYVSLSDGRLIRRADIYAENSPHGWEQVLPQSPYNS